VRESVRLAWPVSVSKWEGRVEHMYLDTKGYATFGIGRKIEDSGKLSDYGLTRPWRDRAGRLVLESAIRTEFDRIHARPELARKGGHAYVTVATLHLAGVDIDEALMDTTATFWGVLIKSLPDVKAWPADAQLALLDMAYHMGPNFLGPSWPKFTAGAKAGDFTRCAANCSTANSSPRDAFHVRLFSNAAAVRANKADDEKLWGGASTPTVRRK
jgi:GH24 family phage-related lysozyme (muramidase)